MSLAGICFLSVFSVAAFFAVDPEPVRLDEALVDFDGLLLFDDEEPVFLSLSSERLLDLSDFLSTILGKGDSERSKLNSAG